MPTGPVLFARYAFGPNRLGLCGPEDWRSLLELGAAALGPADSAGPTRKQATEIDRGLRDLAANFEGAYPYLELIAAANGVEDPLDPRVVDAYWIGNALSDHVDPVLMTKSIDARFRAQLPAETWKWLQTKPEAGARPTHAFHVFDVFPMVGTQRQGSVANAVGLMDTCRIRWGRVKEISGDSLVVNAVPLGLIEGKLALVEPVVQSVKRWLDGSGFVADVEVGDVVSLHWDWACEVLSPTRLEALQQRTLHQLELANQTL
ncbi:MAG: DUF6390 family protein [Candidatus Limnocylindrales bacterium]